MVLGFTTGYGFEEKILSGEKLHSIRPDWPKRWKAGNKIQMVTGNRTKGRRQFAEKVCTGVQEIVVVFDERGKIDFVVVDKKQMHNYELLAKNDGLCYLDFEKFFFDNSVKGVYKGRIIHWSNIRY